jgi:glycosyltransferase involved in cell wall biosynthesis
VRRLCIITPVRDEALYARRTLDSVIAQTERPTRWIIVDDGSTDATPEILAEYAAAHDWIQVIRRDDRGFRRVGGGVIDAFYAGYDTIDANDYDYICKLDLDLDLPPRYFETLLDRMEADPRIGCCSGKAYMELGGKLVSEKLGDENAVGASKLYRRTCFQEIGGFVREVMWDGIDGHRCRMLGWIAVSWDDPELRFVHLRPMGTSDKGWWRGRVRHGYGQWFMGTSFVYMVVSAAFRMTRPPYVLGGLGMLWGYVRSAIRREPRYADPELRQFVRRYQWQVLRKGKDRAVRDLEVAGEWVWRQHHLDPTS